MSKTLRIGLVAGAVVALLAVAAGVGIASRADDDRPLTGSALEQATQAALAATGGGEVVETEVGDDGAAYGVEVRLPDGTQVEIGLDESFQVIGTETDDDGPGDVDDGEGAG